MRSLMAVAALAAIATIGTPAVLHADPADRVARASYTSGQVWMRHGTEQEWMQLVINYPLTSGDQLWTDAGARTEVRLGSAALRLGEQTGLNVDGLESDGVRLTLAQGTLGMNVKSLDANDHLTVSTGLGTVDIMRVGSYRLDIDSAGTDLEVTVRSGAVVVTAASGTFQVNAGQTARVTGQPNPSQDIHEAPGFDAFDSWNADRDRLENTSGSSQYVSTYMTGYEDLDRYGSWQQTPDYGAVWVPAAVAPGWAPYRFGYWAWVSPWGWTWIDQAPWGFAPFHYGRWAYWGGRWVWAPGVRVVRPVYAPALVAFVGGNGWSVSAGFGPGGGVAWFPLAPGEPWVPSYHASPAYIKRVNVTNVNITNVNVTNINVTNYNYRNRNVTGAVTAVSHDDFVAGRAKHGAPTVLHEAQLKGTTVVADAPPVAPRPKNEVARGETKPASWQPYRVPAAAPRPDAQPQVEAHPVSNRPATRVPMPQPAAPENPAVKQERQLDAQHVREHAQLAEKQDSERRATPPDQQAAVRQRQEQEQQQMEARHQTQLNALPPRPATPATAPRQHEKPPAPPNVEKKASKKDEKPPKP